MASDFRLKESIDGTVSFESVIQSGSYVGIKGPAGFQTKLYIFLVVTMVTLQRYNCVSESSLKITLRFVCVCMCVCFRVVALYKIVSLIMFLQIIMFNLFLLSQTIQKFGGSETITK